LYRIRASRPTPIVSIACESHWTAQLAVSNSAGSTSSAKVSSSSASSDRMSYSPVMVIVAAPPSRLMSRSVGALMWRRCS
jgi:hypothetical protein